MVERNGVDERKAINQVANFALLEWPDNAGVGSAPPSEYVPKMRARLSAGAWDRMCRLHALPDDWETLSYEEFLDRRRVLMTRVIRSGFEALSLERRDPDARDDIPEGTSDEQPVWRRIAEVEATLRQLVRQSYAAAYGADADERIRRTLARTHGRSSRGIALDTRLSIRGARKAKSGRCWSSRISASWSHS